MKKLFCILLTFLLLCPLFAAFAIDESQYIGTWVYTEETLNHGLVLEVLYLREDHKVFYIRQFYSNDNPTYTWKSVNTWYPTDKGISIKTGDDISSEYDAILPLQPLPILDLYHKSGGEYKSFIALSSDMLTRMTNEALENYSSETGVRVPMGHWRVGDDIPAGTYSIRLPSDGNSYVYICIWGYDVDNYTANGGLIFHESMKPSNPNIGKIDLKEGWIVDIDGPVLFDEPIKLEF